MLFVKLEEIIFLFCFVFVDFFVFVEGDCLKESISGRIVEPRVVWRATVAGVQSECLAGQLLGGEGAGVGDGAGGGTDWAALLLPGLEVLDLGAGLRVLDPLDDLGHGDEVDVAVLGQDLVHPEEESVHEFGVVLQPGGVEEEAERGAVLGVVAVKVVVEEGVELLARQDVGARVNHGAAGQILVECGVFAAIQLVHHQLPDGVAAGRALLQVAVAAVRHAEVERVRPQRRVLQRSRDGRVVEESLLFHHGELVVAADAQVRSAHTHDRVVGDVGEFVDDETGAGHLLGPVVNGSRRPERLVIVVTVMNQFKNNKKQKKSGSVFRTATPGIERQLKPKGGKLT